MSDIAIRAEGLGKRYLIGQAEESGKTLQSVLLDYVRAPGQRLSAALRRPKHDEEDKRIFWALRDISFEVGVGEVVGLIGRNGAGKSTLLRILSRITTPTEGDATLNGRVGSLLEVGTGFHPELTGRENVFLNGAILGMRMPEIRRKFDDIVAFAEIEKFIDTPVKRYSSGMYIRLAFAVAAHLEPEILMVDEVLAVGDVAFQQKCLGKMGEVAREGRTVLFVSHNMGAIQRLCTRAVLLTNGRATAIGDTTHVMNEYLRQGVQVALEWVRPSPPETDAYFTRAFLSNPEGKPLEFVTTGGRCALTMELTLDRPVRNLHLSVAISDDKGDCIFATDPEDVEVPAPRQAGSYQATVTLPDGILLAKTYCARISLWIPQVGPVEYWDCLRFPVVDTPSLANRVPEGRAGVLAIPCEWSVARLP